MNTQVRMIDTRTFRIAVIAVAAAVLLAAAAYLFGTGLRADTSASVAPSPLGSSLTDVRAARAEAAKWASVAARDRDLVNFYTAVNDTNAAADAAKFGILEAASLGYFAPAAVPAVTIRPSHYARLGSLTAAEAASLGNIAPATVPAMTIRPSHYARLGSLTAAEAASLGIVVPAVPATTLAPSRYTGLRSLTLAEAAKMGLGNAAADPYLNEWMGFTSPESVGAKLSVAPGSAAAQYQSIKPEGIKASGAIEAAPGQYQWIRPGGIK